MMSLLVVMAAVLVSSQAAAPPVDSSVSSAPHPVIPVEFSGIPMVDPPERAGAWTVVVAKRGGIAGFSRSFVTTTSAGAVTCGGQTAICRTALDRPELSALTQLVARSLPAFSTSQPSVCSDCVSTFVLLTMRDDAGRLLRHAASWDTTTVGKVPADLVRLVSTTTSNALNRAR